MKQLVMKLAAVLLVLVLVAPVFAGGSSEKKSTSGGPVQIELWYGSAVTEAGPPPADWKALQILKDKYNIDLKITRMLRLMLPVHQIICLIFLWCAALHC